MRSTPAEASWPPWRTIGPKRFAGRRTVMAEDPVDRAFARAKALRRKAVREFHAAMRVLGRPEARRAARSLERSYRLVGQIANEAQGALCRCLGLPPSARTQLWRWLERAGFREYGAVPKCLRSAAKLREVYASLLFVSPPWAHGMEHLGSVFDRRRRARTVVDGSRIILEELERLARLDRRSPARRALVGAVLEEDEQWEAGDCATFTIGLRVDKPRPGSVSTRKGSKISLRRAREELLRLRAEQVGREATVVRYDDLFARDPSEPVITCGIEFDPFSAESDSETFREHMLDLAEKVAERFGQKEVRLRMGGRLYRANAPGEKGPKPLLPGGKVIR
jgi:hypothetical protein